MTPEVALQRIVSAADVHVLEEISHFHLRMRTLRTWKERLAASRSSRNGFAAPGGAFTQRLYLAAKKEPHAYSLSHLRGQVLLEIGAGCSASGYQFAHTVGARAYLGVEPYYADVLRQSINYIALHENISLPYCIIPEDILSALCRLPDHSVSILACGIEKCILASEHYAAQVSQHLQRVLSPDGSFVTLKSDLYLSNCVQEFSLRGPWGDEKGLVFRS